MDLPEESCKGQVKIVFAEHFVLLSNGDYIMTHPEAESTHQLSLHNKDGELIEKVEFASLNDIRLSMDEKKLLVYHNCPGPKGSTNYFVSTFKPNLELVDKDVALD